MCYSPILASLVCSEIYWNWLTSTCQQRELLSFFAYMAFCIPLLWFFSEIQMSDKQICFVLTIQFVRSTLKERPILRSLRNVRRFSILDVPYENEHCVTPNVTKKPPTLRIAKSHWWVPLLMAGCAVVGCQAHCLRVVEMATVLPGFSALFRNSVMHSLHSFFPIVGIANKHYHSKSIWN